MLSIIRISDWPAAQVDGILVESEQEGFRFVRRAWEEWLSGANRFSREGEAMFGIFDGERLLAIGGVNRESEDRGRLRRLYVLRRERRRGLGRLLVQHLIAVSRNHYASLTLRCDTDAADRFYLALGFTRIATQADVTHSIDLEKEPNETNSQCASRGAVLKNTHE